MIFIPLVIAIILAFAVFYMVPWQVFTANDKETHITSSESEVIPIIKKIDGIIYDGEYDHRMVVGGGILEIYWRVENGYIFIALRGRTSGWVALGFTASHAMHDADIVIGYVTSSNTTVVIDSYCENDLGQHKSDDLLGGSQDIIEYAGTEYEEITIIEFKRLLVTNDGFDKPLPSSGNVVIIWAVSDTDSLSAKHIASGFATLELG